MAARFFVSSNFFSFYFAAARALLEFFSFSRPADQPASQPGGQLLGRLTGEPECK